jgi:hypothetical protein
MSSPQKCLTVLLVKQRCEQLLSAAATHNPHRHSSHLNTTGHIHPHSFSNLLARLKMSDAGSTTNSQSPTFLTIFPSPITEIALIKQILKSLLRAQTLPIPCS